MTELSKQSQIIEALFQIYDKSGQLVPFKLNSVQRDLDQDLIQQNQLREDILKFRQGGVTSFIMAFFLVECLYKYTVAVMLAHDKDHTQKLLERCQLFIKNIRGPQPKMRKMNDNEISFEKTQSTFYIGTAGSSSFGRSATITHLHCSEIAFWKQPKKIMTGLLQAVPHQTGRVITETTGNGWGTWYQKRFYQNLSGKTRTKARFIPWYVFEEYESPSPLLSSYTPRETELVRQFSLSPQQIQWRREKIDEFEGDEIAFNQEYPSLIEDAFKLSGGSLFGQIERVESKRWVSFDFRSSILEGHPHKGYTYVLGADASGGTGNDNAAIEVFCLETKEQVFEYRNNTISPPFFAEEIIRIGKLFNEAFLVPEANSHGLTVCAILRQKYSRSKIYKHVISKNLSQAQLNIPSYGYGWKTTAQTKAYMVGLGQKFLSDGWAIYSPILYDELLSFSEELTDQGNPKFGGVGTSDDNAMAFLLSCVGLLKVLRWRGEKGDEMLLSEGGDELKSPGEEDYHPSWRDENGVAVLKFEEIFKPKRRYEYAR